MSIAIITISEDAQGEVQLSAQFDPPVPTVEGAEYDSVQTVGLSVVEFVKEQFAEPDAEVSVS